MRVLLRKLHLYLSLASALFIIVLGLTGCILAFETELDHLFHSRLYYVTPRPQALSLADIDRLVAEAYPGVHISSYTLARSPELSYQVNTDKGTVFIDEYSGKILGLVTEPDFATAALNFVHSVHIRLTPTISSSSVGKVIVKWVAVIILFLLLSGVYLWWPAKRLGVKKSASGFRFWFDLHNTVGMLSLIFLIVLTVTGILIGFDDQATPVFYSMTGSQPNLIYSRQTFKSEPPPAGAVPIYADQALTIARDALPGAVPIIFNVPGPLDAYVIKASFPEDLTSGGRSEVVIDQYTGRVLAVESSRAAPAGSGIVTTNRAIHTGDIFGPPSKTVLSLASLMMVAQAVTGAMMWWRRRRKKLILR
jgi:uncharacterized iron-regulated membrane protein